MESRYSVILVNAFLAILFAHNMMEARTGLFVVTSVATLDISTICSQIPGLSPEQRTICGEQPKVINCILRGYTLAAKECQYQFRKNRWNCTVLNQESDFDDKAIPGTKEAAYTQAITSAGVVYAVTDACNRGNLSECHCDESSLGKRSRQGWTWGGCSVDTSYGVNISTRFVNAKQSTRDAIYLMNEHNNRAGRQALVDNLEVLCRCHGPSGSCIKRTCWQALPSFRKVSLYLKERFRKSVLVKAVKVSSRHGKRDAYLTLKSADIKTPSADDQKPLSGDLVHINSPQNYCDRDEKRGIPGTRDRKCNGTSNNTADSCKNLCCGRGYNTHEVLRKWKCNCKFFWCCQVKCKKCKERTEVLRCK